ncbi:MAG: hypothetical protein AAF915_10885 [Cyanobacteria bacterium P01_D01_bin.50]
MSDIIYPTIKLYLYDLRNGLGQNSEDIENNRIIYKSKLPENITDSLFEFDTDFEADYVELLGKNKRIEKFSDEAYEGYYYPVRLGDIYGLLLDCSVKDQKIPHPANCFKYIKTQIDSKLNDRVATVGQTWMLTASLADFPSLCSESIASYCYQAVMPDGNWDEDLQGQGNFLGGQIFELWRYRLLLKEENHNSSSQYSLNSSIQNIQENQHVIIALYPNVATAEKAAEFIFDWMPLFCYRHKIMLASAQSRCLKQQLKKDFVFIQNNIKDITQASSQKLELTTIRKILNNAQKTLAEYSTNISYFDYQIRNIELNLENYKKRLSKFPIKASSSNLNFLEQFSKFVESKDLIQIKKDYENLSPGSQLLEGLIQSIISVSSIIEIDEEERERSFQKNIAIFGISLASAGLVAETSDYFVEDIQKLSLVKNLPFWKHCLSEQVVTISGWTFCPQEGKPDPTDAVVAITVSILVGLIVGALTSLFFSANAAIRKRRLKSNRTS